MARDFDKIVKEGLAQLGPLFLQEFLGENASDIVREEALFQRTVEREIDSLFRVPGPKPRLYHLEFQSDNERFMEYRMLTYYALVKEKLKMPLSQCLVFLGEQPLKMSGGLQEDRLDFSYTVIDMKAQDFRRYLEAGQPEKVVMAVLCDIPDEGKDRILKYLVEQLVSLCGDDRLKLNRMFHQLVTLSKLRKTLFVDLEKQLSRMAIHLDVEDIKKHSLFYSEGLEKGLEKGMEQGMEQARAQMARKLQAEGFPEAKIAEMLGVGEQQIKKWLQGKS